MMSTVFLLAAFLLYVGATIHQSGLIVTIREHYGDYYERVGKPSALWNSWSNGSFLFYVILGEFHDDEPPEQVVDALKLSRVLFLLVAALLFLAIGASVL